MKDATTTLLIIFIVLKLIDFNNMSILDYLILISAAVFIVLSALTHIRKGRDE